MKSSRSILVFVSMLVLASQVAHAATFLDGLAMKESTNRPLAPRKDTNGKLVIGYYQLTHDYWADAVAFDKSLDAKHGGSWERCQSDKDYAGAVVMAYMARYCPTAVANDDYEAMGRTHNGGPKGASHAATLGYWTGVGKVKGLKFYIGA